MSWIKVRRANIFCFSQPKMLRMPTTSSAIGNISSPQPVARGFVSTIRLGTRSSTLSSACQSLKTPQASNHPQNPVQPLPVAPQPPSAPAELLPRCDDAAFRARGECIDVQAGPRAVGKDDVVPDLPVVPAVTSRDITVINEHDTSVIAPANGVNGPLIYQFRLAHK